MDKTNKTFGARSHEEQERARDDYQARTSSLRSVGKPIRKKDSMQLLLGQAKYTADLAPQDCLTVKLLRSPHANAIVEEIDTTAALKVDGIEAIYTWKDVDQNGPRARPSRNSALTTVFCWTGMYDFAEILLRSSPGGMRGPAGRPCA